jgi:ribose transport system permease protein
MKTTGAPAERARTRPVSRPGRRHLGRDPSTWGPVIAFVLLIVVFGALRPDTFLSSGNIFSILNNQAVLAIVACGLTLVLLGGEFDLSIAAVMTFAGALSAGLVAKQGMSPLLAIAVVLVIGALIGVANGVLVTVFRVPALIATLAVATILEGLTLWYTNGETIFAGLSGTYTGVGRWSFGQLQAPVVYLAVVGFMLWVLLNYTVPGRYLHALGSNRAAARISGIHVGRYLVMAFVVAGVCAAFAGVLQTARNGSATPTAGAPFLLPAFAAAFLGSTALRRGQFHIVGTVFGVYLIATGSAGFIILGAPFYTQQLFSGAVLLLATMGSRFLSRGR